MREGKLVGLRRSTMGRVRERLRITALDDQLGTVQDRLGRLDRDIDRVWRLLDGHEERLAGLERKVKIATVMAWIAQATLTRQPLISVVIPTRDRADVLPRAIASVVAQSYDRWELIVCSDETDASQTARVVTEFDDPRVIHLPGDGGSAGAARNRGIERASGELIAYLDDDNYMHAHWLKSVAWAFEQRPDVDVLYGAIVIDDSARHHGESGHEMPSAWLEPYDREAVRQSNVADSSAIAHRANLAGAGWDETLIAMGDWDFLLRATADREPLTLPAVACFYYSDTGGRLSELREQNARERATILRRAGSERGGR